MKTMICTAALLVSLSANGCATVRPEVFPRKAPVQDTSFPGPRSYMTTDLPKTRDELRDLIGQTVMDAIHQYRMGMETRAKEMHQPKKGLNRLQKG